MLIPWNSYWFGSGSRIIITSKEKHLLVTHGVNAIYEVRGLEDSEAFQLFCQYAFKHTDPGEDYMQLCYDVIHYSKGLPLALKVLGTFFV